MKSTRLLIAFTLSLVLLFGFSAAFAQGDHQPTNRPTEPPMSPPGHNNPSGMDHVQFGDNGFHNNGTGMNVTGTVTITSQITLTISASPSNTMRTHMADSGSRNMESQYSNTFSVSLTKLVEFNGTTQYRQNSTILSEFSLNSTTLNPVKKTMTSNSTVYEITSKSSNVFKMVLEVNKTTTSTPFAWKWSLYLNYPYISSASKLAVLHKIGNSDNGRQNMMDEARTKGHMDSKGNFNGTQMNDSNSHVPMFFKWDKTAQVDGKVTPVLANAVGDSKVFALTFAHGSSISYDPSIGVSPTAVLVLNTAFAPTSSASTTSPSFMDVFMSPTALGLISATALILVTLVVYRRRS